MKTFKFLFLAATLCIACNPEKVDTRGIKKDMENLKIKKISEGEILSAAESAGGVISDSLQSTISRHLDSAIAKSGIAAAIPFCALQNYPLVDSLEEKYKANISRTSFSDRLANPKNTPDSLEKELLEAYEYSIEKRQQLFKSAQTGKERIIFNAPILLNQSLCLRCHGSPGKDMSQEEYQKLLSAYPKNSSTGLKMNDFMGMWTIKFDKEEFIKGMK